MSRRENFRGLHPGRAPLWRACRDAFPAGQPSSANLIVMPPAVARFARMLLRAAFIILRLRGRPYFRSVLILSCQTR
jgi:hypothetical protein